MRKTPKIFVIVIMIMIATLTLSSCSEIEKAEIEEPKIVGEIKIGEAEESEIELEIEEEIIEEIEVEEVEIIVVEEVEPIILIKSTEVMNEIKDRLMRRMENLTSPSERIIANDNTSNIDTNSNIGSDNQQIGDNNNTSSEAVWIDIWCDEYIPFGVLVRMTHRPDCWCFGPPAPPPEPPPPHQCWFDSYIFRCSGCGDCSIDEYGNSSWCPSNGVRYLPCRGCGASPP